ncbi:DUF3828 domain-containing protein [Paraburkholderia bannensis]|uniref:DUF3828 domain-containing protein n=1 Tax=Paraburkholderia bannensis TaxID=765414 RepID=UPI002AB653FE|nr:DUF3828 domain-containing protein [Paraburkholderia bannensis]
MNKIVLRALWLMLLVLSTFTAPGAFAKNDAGPEATVKSFYSWYIAKQKGNGNPLVNNEIYRWVAKDTVNGLREAWRHDRLPGDVDYFLKVQDFDDQDWARNIALMRAVTVDDVDLVPVSFGSREKSNVIVFLRKQGGVWKIIKVDDLLGYQ